MKKIFLISFLLISFLSFSQMDRRIGRTPNSNNNRKQEKIDPIQSPLNYLKKELTLDSFQEAAVKIFLEENIKEKEYIHSLDATDIEKMDKLKVSYDKMDSQIQDLLNEKQKEVFTKMKDKHNGKDKKKNKKNKKEEKEELEN